MKSTKRQKIKHIWAYLFILPQMVFFVLFTIYPIIMSYIYSFYEWSGIGPLTRYVQFDNFTRLISDERFWNAFQNSLVYIGMKCLILLPLSLIMALLLNRPRFGGKTFYRALYFLPVVTTAAVVGIIMKFIFGNEDALVNSILLQLGVLEESIPWLGRPFTAMAVLILVGSWKFFGMIMIYWLAALQSLPADVYEAAKVDGAGTLPTFRHITVPLLLPYAAVILLLTVVNSMHVFDLAKTLTGGGPFYATETVDLYIYEYAFDAQGLPQMGYASAAGILFGMAIFLLTLFLGWLVKKSGGEKQTDKLRASAKGV
ncbi:carbohydrate ABC transporter permease [Paenibacillus sp. 1P07SE]|uniref:carbohydrate ABC transporter permease n=1 Tax=Paenibacillus sp. 1P07SE TaxID=3132209 RepID=UPI0039A54C1B